MLPSTSTSIVAKGLYWQMVNHMLSFIMPAKNVSPYVSEAIQGLTKANYQDWELIAVDDHSTDDTPAILKEAEKEDSRIKVYGNKGHGKVLALNHGYSLASGDIIKCIDADDVLDMAFFDYLEDIADCDASCHDYYITNADLKVIGQYSLNKAFFSKSFDYCMKNLVSLPRCAWSFRRHIGNVIFPMPETLPFEDAWFSLIIKKYAGPNIRRIARPLYYYRQHDDQVFGGILNFHEELLAFRAKRMLALIDVIQHDETKRLMSGTEGQDFFEDIVSFYTLLAQEKPRLRDIITSGIPARLRYKVLVYRKFNFLAPSLVKLKWLLDRIW